ncbi:MAG: hypothetical protein K5651_01805 [Bacteroidales bacterium]|nr:hypothetical protein [Bacteroidales bacterium]
MISQLEFVRKVDVQGETIDRYIKEGKIKADMSVPISESRVLHYFKPETIKAYAKAFGWTLIDSANIKSTFIKFVRKMDMTYSYKPVLLLALLDLMDEYGRAKIDDVVRFFIDFYAKRRATGDRTEKATSIFSHDPVSAADAKRNILANPFKRFADMRFLAYSKDLEHIEMNHDLFRQLTPEDATEIRAICQEKLDAYYGRIA